MQIKYSYFSYSYFISYVLLTSGNTSWIVLVIFYILKCVSFYLKCNESIKNNDISVQVTTVEAMQW